MANIDEPEPPLLQPGVMHDSRHHSGDIPDELSPSPSPVPENPKPILIVDLTLTDPEPEPK